MTPAIALEGEKRQARRWRVPREAGILAALVVLCLGLAVANPAFLSAYNLETLSRSIAFLAIVALGQTLVLITGEIDLSVGAIGGLSGIVAAWLMAWTQIWAGLAIAAGLLAGMLCGLANGLIVTVTGLSSFIVTLGTMGIFSGLNLVITEGQAIVHIKESVLFLGVGDLAGIPLPVVFALVLLVAVLLALRFTAAGRYIFAVGGNREAAYVVGIRVNHIRLGVFAVSGLLAGFAAILVVARLASAQPTIGESWLLPTISAAVIGGTALTGGEGSPVGTVIGAAIMVVLENAIVMLSISPYWQTVVIGGAVIVAVGVDVLRRLRRV